LGVDRVRRFLVQVLRFGLPANLLFFAALAIWSLLSPWPDDRARAQVSPRETLLLVGLSYRTRLPGDAQSSAVSRSYVAVPSVLSDPRVINVTQFGQSAPVVESIPNGFLFYSAWIGICALGTWWFWLRNRSGPTVPGSPS
jgi:hypothetical protein